MNTQFLNTNWWWLTKSYEGSVGRTMYLDCDML